MREFVWAPRVRAVLMVTLLGFLGMIVGLLIAKGQAGPAPSPAELDAAAARAVAAKVATLFEESCRQERKRDKQIQTRGRAEERIAASQIRSNEALIEVVNDLRRGPGPVMPSLAALGRVLDRENLLLGDVRADIVIIPLPKCADRARLIEEAAQAAIYAERNGDG